MNKFEIAIATDNIKKAEALLRGMGSRWVHEPLSLEDIVTLRMSVYYAVKAIESLAETESVSI